MIINDEIGDARELNNIPYSKALRIDHRTIFHTFISFASTKIEIIDIFCNHSQIKHLSLLLSIYIFSLLLDLTLNCFFYADEVVSQKYHNNGNLTFATSFALSLVSNIIGAIIVFIIAKLTEYDELLEIMVNDICYITHYYTNIMKFKKIVKIKLTLFFIIQFILNVLMLYYLTIFFIVYSHSQTSIMINYLIGVAQSLGKSLGITICIVILRILSIKYKWEPIYNTSRYFHTTF